MSKQFYDRLKTYFENVGKVLRGEAEASAIFPNTSDIGLSRELVYAEFLKQHAPSKCNVYLGGFLFGEDGDESKQLDIIISTDTAPKYDFLNPDGKGKSFGPVEGCLGVASIKSKLDKAQLIDSLKGIASIPETKPLGKRVNPMFKLNNYDNWPLKIIYASDGLNIKTIVGHIDEFYKDNPNIPIYRRPDIIHIAGKYVIIRIKNGINISGKEGTVKNIPVGTFYALTKDSDMQAMLWTLDGLQSNATASNHINFDYKALINKINEL